MLIQELAAEIHRNAVEHGWWEEERSVYEVLALIHSEWSEALEEARAGRPLAYIEAETSFCPQIESHREIITRGEDGKYIYDGREYSGKPEGVAVELIDGVIRILDYLGHLGAEFVNPDNGQFSTVDELCEDQTILDPMPAKVPDVVTYLHRFTSDVLPDEGDECDVSCLMAAMNLAMVWVRQNGMDPVALLMEKHEFNKGRPYKHGKKF